MFLCKFTDMHNFCARVFFCIWNGARFWNKIPIVDNCRLARPAFAEQTKMRETETVCCDLETL